MMGIDIVGIQKSYKNKKVLEDVSLTAEEGNCVGILGANGCGKSTLLSVLSGVQKADGGVFLFQGEDILKRTSPAAALLGYVPQGNALIEELNAWDNLRLWHDKKTIRRELSGGVLSMLGIDKFLKTPIHKMSEGMKKRVSIGCVVAAGPKLLLLDEPSAALDIVCKERIYSYLKRFKEDGGIILLTTHDIQELELCDRCFILKQGRLTPYEYDGNIHRLTENL